MRTICIRIGDHTDSMLAAYCKRHGVNRTRTLKIAIAHLAEVSRPTPPDLAARLGLIAGFRSAEGDLALNHSMPIKERLQAKHGRAHCNPSFG